MIFVSKGFGGLDFRVKTLIGYTASQSPIYNQTQDMFSYWETVAFKKLKNDLTVSKAPL